MSESTFWDKYGTSVPAIVDSIDNNMENTFIWVTNLKERQTWCSSKMKDYFGMADQTFGDFEQYFIPYVHPRELGQYKEKMSSWLVGQNLDAELGARLRRADGNYYVFSFHANVLCGEEGTPEFLTVAIENQNVVPKFDSVTDLYTYAKYVEDLDDRIAHFERLALLQIQVEGFNTFNLIYGLDYSGQLVREISHKFIGMMDMQKAVYRLESERFVFILKDAGREELLQFEQQVRCALDEGVMLEGKRISLKMSAGGILLENYRGDSSSVRGQVAYALNHSMHQHQGQLVIFNDEVQTSRGENLTLMRVIHQSVQDNCEGFYVEYQPIVAAQTGEVVGAEALVRWNREPYGVVPPGRFIEWMETDPSMYDLGNYVLRTACVEMRPLLEIKKGFFVNVNVSVRQLERPEFHEELQRILEETGFPADHLCMELTERCKDFPLDKLKEEVEFFQGLGIRMAMDDYGTGSASSSIVMNIPMDEIKLDMSFIRNIRDNEKNQEMVHSILYFAEKTNMTTCLEGVENEELQNYLRDYNATWFQGYYYAKPLPAQSLETMVQEQLHAKE